MNVQQITSGSDGWQIASSVATMVQAAVVTLSLYYIARQVKQQTEQAEQQTKELEFQTKLVKVAHAQDLFELTSPFNIQVIQDRNMAKLIFEGHEDYGSFDEVDKFRYRSSLSWRLTFQELMYYQNQNGLLDASIYQAWDDDFKSFLKRRRVGLRWAELEQYYNPEFRSYVSSTIKAIESGNAQ